MDQSMKFTGEPIEIFVSARGLKNLNNIYLSDPQCFVYEHDSHQGNASLLGQSEIAKHNLNPDWRQTIKATYYFNRTQEITLKIIDSNQSVVGKLTQLVINGEEKKEFIGLCKTTIAQLMGAKGCVSRLQLFNEKGEKSGIIVVFVDKVKEQSQVVKINWQWGGHKLLKMDFFGKSDPYAKFFKYTPTKEKVLLYESEVIKKTLDPKWKAWDTELEKICQNSELFFVEVFDYDRIGGHDFIGEVEINIKDILDQDRQTWELKTRKGKYGGNLDLIIKSVHTPPPINTEITFLDYLRGGWSLSMIAAIDFTFSNGPLNRPESLHKITPGSLNFYQQALKYVGQVIIAFDSDKLVPLFGFGGVPKFPSYTKNYSDDCFPLNGDIQNPGVNDIDGILQTYENAVNQIEFAGPTYIAKLLEAAYQYAQNNLKDQAYTVGYILTDGQIEDMEDSYKAIAKLSPLPVSIIIIGVGDDDFTYMKRLDNVEEIKKRAPEDLKNQVRQITQFVAMKDYQNDVEKLCQNVLDTMAKQFMDYMKINNKKPRQLLKAQMSILDRD